MERPMQKLNDLSRSLTALEPNGTLIAVIEMSLSSWRVAGIVPGVERQPLKKLAVDESALLKLLHRWREEAEKAGRRIERIAVAFEAGRDGFWLARWLKARGIEVYVIHASSVAVSREHRRAKTDRLDTELLKRSFLGWLRGERDRRERKETPRERAGPFGQCPGPPRHDSIGVAVPSPPKEQRPDEVVSIPHRERSRYSKAHDRGLGAQATDRPVAAHAGGHCPGWRCFASGTMNEGR